jgi:myo-inositol catabolism protein IolC
MEEEIDKIRIQYSNETGDKVKNFAVGRNYFDTAYVRWLERKLVEVLHGQSVLDYQER